MATAAVDERQLLKTLRWYDGFVIALANPGFLLLSLAYSVGDLGGWGAALLWGISATVAVFINTIYSELAAMFPDKSGGLALYAHEAWRKYTTLVGPIATFGYWIGWSVVLASSGLFIGSVIQGAWFADEPGGGYLLGDGYFSVFGLNEFGLPAAIAIGLIIGVWLFNVFGTRVGVTFGYIAGALLMIPLFIMIVVPFLNGSFDSANLTYNLNNPGLAWGGMQLALIWLWLMCWSAWGWTSARRSRPSTRTRHGTRSSRSAPRLSSRWSCTSRFRSPSSAAPARRRSRPTTTSGNDVDPRHRLGGGEGLTRLLSRCQLHHHDEHCDR